MGEIPYLDYARTELAAAKFLARCHPEEEIPVPIEGIVEHRLHMDIIPVPGLFDRIGVSGFLSNDIEAIYIDQYEMEHFEARYRFTLAHELGHRVLHAAFYRGAKIRKTEDFLRFRESLSGADLGRLEIQAMNFAGALLMQRKALAAQVKQAVEETHRKLGPSATKSVRFLPALARRISRVFLVSTEAAENRLWFGRFV